ncbi:hypothetical protein [Olegusella massiliensis]|uniref:hypothetical protein n=1 Tax=Olegusella massiliensis TaxID=1776381 RepID=UPI0011DE1449|nr:hypothetical protein [Olegusella massiliensis]
MAEATLHFTPSAKRHIPFHVTSSQVPNATFRFMSGAKRHVLLHFFSQKPRFISREKNLSAETSGPLKQNVAFDIFSETQRGFWQAAQ